MLYTLLFCVYSYILSLCELIRPHNIKILYNNNVLYGMKLYIRYVLLICIYKLNRLINNDILLLTKNYFDHDCSHFKLEHKIIRCKSLYEGICIFNQESTNKNASNLFNIHKIVKIYFKLDNTNKNILPELINYVGKNNKFIDVIEIEYMPTNNDVLCIELMVDLFNIKTYEVTIDQIIKNDNVENVLDEMGELHTKKKWFIGNAYVDITDIKK